jgi:hypothetical protein
MDAMKRLEKMLMNGHITVEEYQKQRAQYEEQRKGMTAEEIIRYLELELAVAHEMYDEVKGLDQRKAMIHMVRVSTITHLLESIKGK